MTQEGSLHSVVNMAQELYMLCTHQQIVLLASEDTRERKMRREETRGGRG
jgi:hypothetical protein